MLAQLDAKRVELDMRPSSLREMVEDVISIVRPIADEMGVAVQTELSGGALCVLCDRDRIVQVLLGFVDNAVKHSSQEGTVTLGARVVGPDMIVEVADDGPGIPEDARDKVFDRFYRVGGGEGPQGAGLGLSIAKEIVEAHGSSIELESEPGQGATFRFTIPCTPGCSE
jgi:signal transduction histidine kinase